MSDAKLPPIAPLDRTMPTPSVAPVPAPRALLLPPQTMLTHELIRDVCEILRKGNFRMTAAQRLGIPYGRLCSWMKRGKTDFENGATTIYAHFFQSVEATEADCESAILEDVLVTGDTRAKIWFLEVRHNKKYNKNTNVVFDDEAGTVQRLDPLQILADRLRELKERTALPEAPE